MPDFTEIKYLYENWLNEIRKRGTPEISSLKGGRLGMCVFPDLDTDVIVSTYKEYDLGKRYSFEFDVKLEDIIDQRIGYVLGNTDSTEVGSIAGGDLLTITTEGAGVSFNFYGVVYNYTGDFDVVINFRVIRDGVNFYVYLNGEQILSQEGSLLDVGDKINYLLKGNTPKLANLKIKKAYEGDVLYGKLYNHHALDVLSLPGDWKIMDHSGWSDLSAAIGGGANGVDLKSTGTIEGGDGLWVSPNTATDPYGFKAHPNGTCDRNGFFGVGEFAYWIFKHEILGTEWEVYINSGFGDNLSFFPSGNTGFGGAIRLYRDNSDNLYSDGDVVYDIDGNHYTVVTLAGEPWAYFKENYSCIRDVNNKVIKNIENNEEWLEYYNQGIPAVRDYNNKEIGFTFFEQFSLDIPFNNDEFYVKERSGEYVARFLVTDLVGLGGAKTSLFLLEDDDFANGHLREVNGELSRILERKTFDEHILSLVEPEGIGINLGTSSPSSKQSYPIINFNKFANKNRDIYELSGFMPMLTIDSGGLIEADKFKIEKFVFPDERVLKLTANPGDTIGFNNQSNLYGDSNYDNNRIPVSPSLNYEISFRVYVDFDYDLDLGLNGGSFKLTFGLNGFNSLGVYVPNSFLNAVSGVVGNKFFNQLSFSTAPADWYANRFEKRWVWVRGILFNSSEPLSANYAGINLNLGSVANHIKFNGTNTRFVQPNFEFFFESYPVEVPPKELSVYIKDFQVRPIELPIQRGAINVKNVMLNLLKNNSGMSDGEITRIMEEKLLPYNTVTKTKFI